VPEVQERHRHRWEFNNGYRELLAEKGLVFSGISPDGRLVEIAELRDHPFMLGSQFHPEFKSRPNRPHPLFAAFMAAAVAHQEARRAAGERPVAPEPNGQRTERAATLAEE
jgi:CTP synthase